MKKKWLILPLLLGLLGACSGTPEEEFIDSCVSSANDLPDAEALCSCTYKKLAKQYGQETLDKVIGDPSSPQLYQVMESSIEKMLQCAEEKGVIKSEGYWFR